MRQGMRHTLTVQRLTVAPNDYGTEVEAWADLATLRAEVIERAAAAAEDETAGTRGRERVTFRTRALGGLTLAERVIWQGRAYELREVRDAGRGEDQLVCEGAA